ncbi:MAG: hypothetical protein AAFV86_00140 [Pseudomonadota bacterium]
MNGSMIAAAATTFAVVAAILFSAPGYTGETSGGTTAVAAIR